MPSKGPGSAGVPPVAVTYEQPRNPLQDILSLLTLGLVPSSMAQAEAELAENELILAEITAMQRDREAAQAALREEEELQWLQDAIDRAESVLNDDDADTVDKIVAQHELNDVSKLVAGQYEPTDAKGEGPQPRDTKQWALLAAFLVAGGVVVWYSLRD